MYCQFYGKHQSLLLIPMHHQRCSGTQMYDDTVMMDVAHRRDQSVEVRMVVYRLLSITKRGIL